MKILSIKSRRQGASTDSSYVSITEVLPVSNGYITTDSISIGPTDNGRVDYSQQWKATVPNLSQAESPDIEPTTADRDMQIIADATDDKLLYLKNLIDIELVERGILKVDKTSTIEI